MKTMSASLKKRFGSLYWQQFFLTAGMVLLTMLLLGVSFFALSYNYTVSEKRDEMNERAKLMASVSVPFLETADSGQSDDQEENLMSMARVASMVSNVNFLIGDANGNILLTTDEQFVNKTITLPADVTQQIVSEGCYEGRTRLGSMYQLKQYVVGVPAVDSQSGELVGMHPRRDGKPLAHADVALVYRAVLHDLGHHSADCLRRQLADVHAPDPAHPRDGAGHARLRQRRV